MGEYTNLGEMHFLSLRHPLRSMFVREILTTVSKNWALDRKPATCFVNHSGIISYDDYLKK